MFKDIHTSYPSRARNPFFGILFDMKKLILLLIGLVSLCVTGCVNQSIAARRSDIPWNAPARADATSALPDSLMDQYE